MSLACAAPHTPVAVGEEDSGSQTVFAGPEWGGGASGSGHVALAAAWGCRALGRTLMREAASSRPLAPLPPSPPPSSSPSLPPPPFLPKHLLSPHGSRRSKPSRSLPRDVCGVTFKKKKPQWEFSL